MGACGGKKAKGTDGKGLTDAKAEDENAGASLENRPHLTVVPDGAVVQELFPKAKQSLSVCGRPPHGHQNAFSERAAELFPSLETLGSFGLGCVCKKGLKPESPNMDDFCLMHADGVTVLGVFDGHGPYGDRIAACVQDFLPRSLVGTHDIEERPQESLQKAFADAHDHACAELNCKLSGTTATVVIHQAEDEATPDALHVANVGDSRAVLCRREKKNKLVGEELTVDHRPSSSSESKRVKNSAEGQLRKMQGDKMERVFLKGKPYPGLATTRSIGDEICAKAGVICKPEVQTRSKQKKENWEFLLICSDGVWQKMTTQEAIDIVGLHTGGTAQAAAENLAAEAWNRWISDEENLVDDITVLVFFFDHEQRRQAEAEAKEKAAAAKGKKKKDVKGADDKKKSK